MDRVVFGRDSLLRFQLSQNPSNRMAYEYLIAHCLLRKRLDVANEYLRGYRQFGYATMPEHWAEALLLVGPRSPDAAWIRARGISENTLLRAGRLCGAMHAARGERRALAQDAAERLPGSYYVYFLSEGASGARD